MEVLEFVIIKPQFVWLDYKSSLVSWTFIKKKNSLKYCPPCVKVKYFISIALDWASSNVFVVISEYTWPTTIMVMVAASLFLFMKILLQQVYVVMTKEDIKRLITFFRTKLMNSAKFVVIWPHCWSLFHVRFHFFMEP